MPELGAGAGEPILLSVWFADLDEQVYAGDRLVEVLVAVATFDVPAPASGRLAEIAARPDDIVRPGQVLGFIETDEGEEGRVEDLTELE